MLGSAYRVFVSIGLALSLLGLGGAAIATPLGPQPAVDLQGHGLSIAEGGVGLEGLADRSRSISVTIGGPAQRAYLYWSGRNATGCTNGSCFEAPNAQPFDDQQLVLDGTTLTGSITGTEGDSIGYVADVTGIVQARGTGAQTFSIADADLSKNLDRLNGAGLLVVYTDPSDTTNYRIMIAHGLDFAYRSGITFPASDDSMTSPVSFSFDPSATDRSAQLTLFAGDAAAAPSDRVDVSDNTSIFDSLDASDGRAWDTDTHSIGVPASATTTTVQMFSASSGTAEPDSIMWVVAALRVPAASGTNSPPPGSGGSGGSGGGGGTEEPPPGEEIVHERSITLSVRHARRPGRLLLRGMVRTTDGTEVCSQNVRVTLARKVGGVWTAFASVETDLSGRFVKSVRHRRGRYRASLGADQPETCGAALSPVVRHRHRR